MNRLRQYIQQQLSEHKLRDRSIVDVLSLLKGYGENTWIFYDTETTGLNANVGQLTQIAAVAATPNGWQKTEILKTFDKKIKLSAASMRMVNDPKSKEALVWGAAEAGFFKNAQEILDWQRYAQTNREYFDEKEAIDDFMKWVGQFPNPLIVAQNAAFDMKWVNVRYKALSKQQNAWKGDNEVKDKNDNLVSASTRWPVLDTKQLTNNTLIPMLKSLEAEGDIDAAELLAKLKTKSGRYSASMGVVAKSFDIDTSGHHDALEDSEMMMDMYLNIYRTIETASNVNVDITAAQADLAVDDKRNAARTRKNKKAKGKSIAAALKNIG